MASFRELRTSRELTNDKKSGYKITYRAIITGASDEEVAEAIAQASMPDVIGVDLVLQNYTINNEGAGVFMLEGEYSKDDEPEAGDGGEEGGETPPEQPTEDEELGAEFSFDIGGGTVKQLQALATTAYARPAIAVIDVKNLIQLSDEGVEGVDVPCPLLEMTIKRKRAGVDLKYIRLLNSLVGKINDRDFYTFKRGEVKFMGAPSQQISAGVFTFSYKFLIAENLVYDANNPEIVKQLTIGDIVLTGGKLGWDFVWTDYEDSPEAVAGKKIQRPRNAFVQQISPFANFNQLGC